ncbi:cbb3-type cytochrome c oxidase N-terminal domain-containing protein [Bdellovibrio sp. KM01]|uniref:cbb3-type cytochrome c oxidase N-terminal domain-containing protein n=1 Tax=Bdellovibrio sp. KM01 TaxID=2748865 RepID=UPI0015E93738|nr:cbb3-type cytochrome c oxidase N-terminal domain-containing protein [Bdellovibrio sp. KM01]QLY24072.1 c-type cytochrome [Bdellovibrio sp. KM01]
MQDNNNPNPEGYKQLFHEYDGIIEHDNPLPTWWLWTFFLTIIFASLYFLHYQFGGGITLQDELAIHMTALEKEKATQQASAPAETEDSLKEAFEKIDANAGAAVFAGKCAACHGQELQGLIGPNLTDHFWIHGKGTRMDIVKVIREGAADKGMPPWGPVLKREELYSVAKYIMTKLDSKPAGAKPPQGEEVK